MAVDPKEADQMRVLLRRIADKVYVQCPSDAADEALRTVIDLSDPDELPGAVVYMTNAAAEMQELLVRSVRHHDERDRMH